MRRRVAVLVAAILVACAAAPAAQAADPAPWQTAQALRDALGDVQTELIVGSRADARTALARASDAVARLDGHDAAADRDAQAALAAAQRAVRTGDTVALAAARGTLAATTFRSSLAATLDAAGRGDARTARAWLLVREFRTATRFTRPGTDATLAISSLERGTLDADKARDAVRADELDAYQARLRELLTDAARGADRDLPARRAEAAAQAEGYFAILAPRYAEDLGARAAADATATFASLRAAAVAGEDIRALLRDAAAKLEGFVAVPLTEDQAARRAQQLLRFLSLVPVEYGRGVNGTKVTKDFEIQEAVVFQTGTDAALDDLANQLAERDATRTRTARALVDRLGVLVDGATTTPDRVASHDEVKAVADQAEDTLEAIMPGPWREKTSESDYDLIKLTLDRMEAAVSAGEYRQAEQARLEAYAFFEFGPERRLQAFNPGLALDVEGLVWFGARGHDGLAKLIARRASRREIHETRVALNDALEDAAATLGDSANATTVVTNSAILVFREGLEAVMILAAITASFVGAKRRLRRPVLIGAGLGLGASVITFIIAETLLSSLTQYGEKLEAVVGLVAIAVLLLVTNWFFHKVYWSEWIGRFHRKRKHLEKVSRTGFISAQALGLLLLGLSSVYREGFETVLFLQSLQLSAGTGTVLEGTALGLVLTFAVAVAIFGLQRKLPYKKMLIVTGVLIGVVLVVMVGQTARTMQGTGWLPITAIDLEPPSWLGLWLGVFPTWETIGAQLLAAAFVIGSYVLAQEVRVKRPQRRARRRRAQGGGAEVPAVAVPMPAPAVADGGRVRVRSMAEVPGAGRDDG